MVQTAKMAKLDQQDQPVNKELPDQQVLMALTANKDCQAFKELKANRAQ
jgi:hypothetical protein